MLLFSLGMALIWWIVALVVRDQEWGIVWWDQEHTFTQVIHHLRDPYTIQGFVNPPWTGVLLIPFGLMPLALGVLVQTCLFFTLLTGVIFKFGGTKKTVLLVLTSYFALDAVLEANIEWLVLLGLLLPTAYSGPFLVIKPQSALGYWFSLRWRDLLIAVLVLLIFLLITLAIWGLWPVDLQRKVSRHFEIPYNLAPMALIPIPLSLLIGVVLAYFAFKRHDPALGIFAWLFFVPYTVMYSLILPFACLAVRYPRIALAISIGLWTALGIIFGAYGLTQL